MLRDIAARNRWTTKKTLFGGNTEMKISDLKRTAVVLPAALVVMASATAQAADYKIEISLETGPNHVRNISVVKLAKTLEGASGGKLEVKVFHGASK
jgi:TRAP-type C4-dicarboxylate transport system substrate-binding protein